MEDTPDMLRAKNATQILNEVGTQLTACTGSTEYLLLPSQVAFFKKVIVFVFQILCST